MNRNPLVALKADLAHYNIRNPLLLQVDAYVSQMDSVVKGKLIYFKLSTPFTQTHRRRIANRGKLSIKDLSIFLIGAPIFLGNTRTLIMN